MEHHELWQEFKEHTARIARDHTRLRDEQINRLTDAMIDRFRYLWGGMMVYFPKDNKPNQCERDKAIFAAYDGKTETITALARDYGMSEIHIYRIIKKQRKLRQQNRIPPTPPAKS